MSRAPVAVQTFTSADTRRVGSTIGKLLRAGDLLVLSGGLAAGKTTLTQGIAEGLEVRGPVTSPTFVIARTHPSLRVGGGPPLVHVDAYRLGGVDELDDLDLDADLDRAVTVVEWGAGLAEQLHSDRLLIDLAPVESAGSAELGAPILDVSEVTEVPRQITLTGTGARWGAECWQELGTAVQDASRG